MAGHDNIMVESIVSATTGRGIVTIKWGEEAGQLEAWEARQLAFNILEAADAAESDAFVCHWCRDRLKLDHDRMAAILNDFRTYRAHLEKERNP